MQNNLIENSEYLGFYMEYDILNIEGSLCNNSKQILKAFVQLSI
jgi:hypothetical protein